MEIRVRKGTLRIIALVGIGVLIFCLLIAVLANLNFSSRGGNSQLALELPDTAPFENATTSCSDLAVTFKNIDLPGSVDSGHSSRDEGMRSTDIPVVSRGDNILSPSRIIHDGRRMYLLSDRSRGVFDFQPRLTDGSSSGLYPLTLTDGMIVDGQLVAQAGFPRGNGVRNKYSFVAVKVSDVLAGEHTNNIKQSPVISLDMWSTNDWIYTVGYLPLPEGEITETYMRELLAPLVGSTQATNSSVEELCRTAVILGDAKVLLVLQSFRPNSNINSLQLIAADPSGLAIGPKNIFLTSDRLISSSEITCNTFSQTIGICDEQGEYNAEQLRETTVNVLELNSKGQIYPTKQIDIPGSVSSNLNRFGRYKMSDASPILAHTDDTITLVLNTSGRGDRRFSEKSSFAVDLNIVDGSIPKVNKFGKGEAFAIYSNGKTGIYLDGDKLYKITTGEAPLSIDWPDNQDIEHIYQVGENFVVLYKEAYKSRGDRNPHLASIITLNKNLQKIDKLQLGESETITRFDTVSQNDKYLAFTTNVLTESGNSDYLATFKISGSGKIELIRTLNLSSYPAPQQFFADNISANLRFDVVDHYIIGRLASEQVFTLDLDDANARFKVEKIR